MNISIDNEAEMLVLAERIASNIQAGDCITLSGELGAGKSFLARGIMRLLGVRDEALPSPTFSIIQEYQADHGIQIAHMDWYRLGHADEVQSLGVDEFFQAPWVSLIEWSERAPNLLPEHTLAIHISLGEQQQQRCVHISQNDKT
ncbi:MAG: tRNA (adenosine(37)-N6)-threonylcarbamoyltransferase complex ATPase subunit type 1 TsaE [Mariprofundaceae bacterium]|nr:tRNA (adenosine(37)-N6)-threonylcarbamoyltransferase complex ATPase subunit type 1 TsaE [Mariprofundaceae bacterium]